MGGRIRQNPAFWPWPGLSRPWLVGLALYVLLIFTLCPLLHHHLSGGLPVYPHLTVAGPAPPHHPTPQPQEQSEQAAVRLPGQFLLFEALSGSLGLLDLSLIVPLLLLPLLLFWLRTSRSFSQVALLALNPPPLAHPPSL